MTTTPGVTVQEKDVTDSVHFSPGSIFAIAVGDAGSTITVADGTSLTLSVASSNTHALVPSCLYYTKSAASVIKLCQFSDGQYTVAGLGLVCQGPNEFQLMASSSREVHVSGSISRTVNAEAAVNNNAPIEANVEEETKDLVVVKVAAAQQQQTKKKRKLDAQALIDELKEMQQDDNDIVVEDDDTTTTIAKKKKANDVDVEAQQPFIQVQLSKNQRKKLAKQKAKELEATLLMISGRDTAQQNKNKNVTTHQKTSITKERRLKGGVLVQDIILGQGQVIIPGRKVSILYKGSLEDGKVFDKTNKKPLEFRQGTGQVVKGLEQGLNGMRVGGEREITIPPALGYGAKGSGLVIPPNATLTFAVTLQSVGGT